MNPERAIEVLTSLSAVDSGDAARLARGPTCESDYTDACEMGAAALAEVAALRAENAEAKAMLAKVEHLAQPMSVPDGMLDYRNWPHVTDCVACARDRRWPVKETPR